MKNVVSFVWSLVKFIYSEKATEILKTLPIFLTLVSRVKMFGNIFKNFVAFSEYLKFGSISCQNQAILLKVKSRQWKQDLHFAIQRPVEYPTVLIISRSIFNFFPNLKKTKPKHCPSISDLVRFLNMWQNWKYLLRLSHL